MTGTSEPEQLISQVFAALLTIDSTISCFIGRRESENFAVPHSITAVPMGAPAIDENGLKPGGTWGDNGGRQLVIRHFAIEWRCHDGPATPSRTPDFTNSNALAIQAMRQIRVALAPDGTPFNNAAHFSDEEWIDQSEGQDSFERSGSVIKFVSVLDIPIYEAQPRIVSLTSTPKITTTVTELDATVTIDQG